MNVCVAAVTCAAALSVLGQAASAEVTHPVGFYDKVLVDEIELSYDSASPLKSLSDAEAKRVRDAARAALASATTGRYAIVDEPAPGAIRVHAVITGIAAAKKDKHFWRFTPIGFVKTRVDVASGTDFVVRAAIVNISVFDALSGKQLIASTGSPQDDDAAPHVETSLHDVVVVLESRARALLVDVGAREVDDAGTDLATGSDEP